MELTKVGYPAANLVLAKVNHARRIVAAERAVEDAKVALAIAEMRLEAARQNGPLSHG